jgi:hypothetical protein
MSLRCGRVQHYCASVLERENNVNGALFNMNFFQRAGQEVIEPYLEVLRCVKDVMRR